MSKKVLVIGGGGYVGSILCPALVAHGYAVTAYDTFWYGEDKLSHSVKKVTGDMRDLQRLKTALQGQKAVIHLACISNDPSFDLNPALGKSINLDCFPEVFKAITDSGAERFIYASSSSVYGVHNGEVTEETNCKPLTDYSRFKLQCEDHIICAPPSDMNWTIVRPATVCGLAPRLRLDLIVNALTVSALAWRQITVSGGTQMRPNLHIEDMVLAYLAILEGSIEEVHREIFNVGTENVTINALADRVVQIVADPGLGIRSVPTEDNRSYHINSDLIRDRLGFEPLHSVEDAVLELMKVFPYLKDPMNNPAFHNIKRMKELGS